MGLKEDLFPDEDGERLPSWIQTDWADDWSKRDENAPVKEWETEPDWGAQLAGLGDLTGLISKHYRELHAHWDQAGLGAVFLQRHRLEVGIKALLAAVGKPNFSGHVLAALWKELEVAVVATDLFNQYGSTGQEVFGKLIAPHAELVDAMNGVDAGSYTFRYPVDPKGGKTRRPRFIDFAVMEKACTAFEEDVTHLLDMLDGVE